MGDDPRLRTGVAGRLAALGHAVIARDADTAGTSPDLVLAILPDDPLAEIAAEAGGMAEGLGVPLVLLAPSPDRDLARRLKALRPAALLPLDAGAEWLAAALEIVRPGQAGAAGRAPNDAGAYRDLCERLRDGLARVDMQGRIVDCNQVFLDMLGYDREEITRLGFRDITPAEWHARESEILDRQVIALGRSDPYPKEYVRKNGDRIPVELVTYLERNQDGTPEGMWAIVRDLSVDREAQYALAASQDKFRSLVEHINDWVWEVDRHGVYTYSSPRVRTLLGYEPEEIVGRTPLDLMSPTESARLRREYGGLIKNRLPLQSIEKICLHKSGQPVLLETSARPTLDARGRLTGYIGVDRDITESVRVQVEIRRLNKELEEKAARSEEKFRTLFEQANDSIFIVDPATHRFLEFNQTAASQLGYTRDELARLRYDDITVPLPPGRFKSLMLELEGHGRAIYEHAHRHKDGSQIPVEICVQEVSLGPRQVWQGIVRDITKRKQAEDGLRQVQQLTRSTLDALSANIAILDHRGTILDTNRSWNEFARENGEPNSQVGMNYLAVCDRASDSGAEGASPAAQGIRLVLRGDLEHFHLQYPCHRPDEQRWFEMRVTRFDHISGPRVVVAHEDVTQSHLARLALQQQHDFLDTLIEAIPNPVFYKDARGRYTGCNRSFEAFLGRPRDQIIGRTVHEIHPPRLADIYHREDSALLAKGGAQQYENQVLGADGRLREVVFNKAAISGPDGAPAGLVGVISDITERKLSEEALAWQAQVDASLADLSAALLSSASVEEVSGIILERAKAVTGSQVGYVGYIDEETGFLVAPAMSAGVWEACRVNDEPAVFKQRRGLWGRVLDQRRPLISNSPVDDPGSIGASEGHIAIDRFLSVPALMGDVLLGQIALANPPRDYDQRDLAALERMASLWALAMHRKRERAKLDKRTRELVERIKELNCLYDTARLIDEKDLTWEEILQGVADSIRNSWKDPGIVACRIGLFNVQVSNGASTDFLGCHTSPILVHGLESGYVEVCYTASEARPDQSPFMRDDRLMINAVAAHLGKRYERHLAERALREARDQLEQRVAARTRQLAEANRELLDYHLAVEGVAEMITVLDKDLTCRMANRSLLDRCGLDRRRAIGAHASEVLGRAAFAEVRDPMRLCLDGRTVQRTLELDYPKDGRRAVLAHFYPLVDEDGRVDRLVAVFNDVTETRKLERQLMLSEKLASLGLLVSGIAHEINNPNNFISFNLPILREYLDQIIPVMDEHAAGRDDLEILGMSYQEFREDLFELLDNMQHGSERINSTVSGLREFSRGDDLSQWRMVDPGGVVDKAVALCQGKIKGLVRTFEVRVAEGLPMIFSSPHILEQILINLLINAAQAGDKPDSRVLLWVDRAGSGRRELAFTVQDNGSGMSRETLNKIFDPFYTTKKPGEGTGLGLYICHNLVQSLGGRIEVDSAEGQGSTFRLVVPAGTEP